MKINIADTQHNARCLGPDILNDVDSWPYRAEITNPMSQLGTQYGELPLSPRCVYGTASRANESKAISFYLDQFRSRRSWWRTIKHQDIENARRRHLTCGFELRRSFTFSPAYNFSEILPSYSPSIFITRFHLSSAFTFNHSFLLNSA